MTTTIPPAFAAVLAEQDEPVAFEQRPQPRPSVLPGTTIRTESPLGTVYVTVNYRSDAGEAEPSEVFLNIGKVGSEAAAVAEAMGRLCSLCLRVSGDLTARERLEAIVEQLSGIGGERSIGLGPNRVRSLPDALARVLAEIVRSQPEPPEQG